MKEGDNAAQLVNEMLDAMCNITQVIKEAEGKIRGLHQSNETLRRKTQDAVNEADAAVAVAAGEANKTSTVFRVPTTPPGHTGEGA